MRGALAMLYHAGMASLRHHDTDNDETAATRPPGSYPSKGHTTMHPHTTSPAPTGATTSVPGAPRHATQADAAPAALLHSWRGAWPIAAFALLYAAAVAAALVAALHGAPAVVITAFLLAMGAGRQAGDWWVLYDLDDDALRLPIGVVACVGVVLVAVGGAGALAGSAWAGTVALVGIGATGTLPVSAWPIVREIYLRGTGRRSA